MIAFNDAVAQIEGSADYYTFFGPAPGEPAAHVKETYRRYVRAVHPDLHRSGSNQISAEAAFKRLGEHYAQALRMVDQNMYGQPVEIIAWKSRRASHSVFRSLNGGTLCATFAARTRLANDAAATERPTFCKVVKVSADNDLLQAEAKALRKLRGPGTNAKLHVFYPELLDSFVHREKAKQPRQVNVLTYLDGFYDLTQVRRGFPLGLPSIHVAWIWRRVLWVLADAHQQNVVHGAVLPEHIMILPGQHGVVLADWCYASIKDDTDGFAPIKAIVGPYRDWYPKEVFAKAAPHPGIDLAMAARCMIQLLGGDPIEGNYPASTQVPRQVRAYFRGCLASSQLAHSQDALQLLGEFDQLLEVLGPPYYPRRFRPLTMPSGIVKN